MDLSKMSETSRIGLTTSPPEADSEIGFILLMTLSHSQCSGFMADTL
jgi:hypothetical protein